MNKRDLRRQKGSRVVIVGCQFCGAPDRPLRNYGRGKICPECMKRRSVSKSDTRKE